MDYYQNYIEFSDLIISMREKLLAAKQKSLNTNFDDAERKIENLEKLQTLYHKMYQSQISLENYNFKITKQFHIMDEKIKLLEQENKQLKENINI